MNLVFLEFIATPVPQRRIFLVEDSLDLAESTSLFFEIEGHDVKIALTDSKH